MTVTVNIDVFWYVTPCALVHSYRRFTTSCRLRVQCFCSIVYVRIARLCTWSGNFYQTTCLHVPKFTNLYNHSYDKLKSQQINKSTSPLTTGLFQGPIQSMGPHFFFVLAQQPPVDQGRLIDEVSRSHTTVGLLWTSDQLVAETST